MPETVTPQEIMEAAKAEQARREEAWAEKIIARGAEERGEKEEQKEAEAELELEGRLEDGGVAQISPEFIPGAEAPVKLEFRENPEPGTLMYLEKPAAFSAEFQGTGFRKFFRAEDPIPSVKKQEGTVYLRAVPVNPEEFEARKAEAEDMRRYLTDETILNLGLSVPEAEALRVTA